MRKIIFMRILPLVLIWGVICVFIGMTTEKENVEELVIRLQEVNKEGYSTGADGEIILYELGEMGAKAEIAIPEILKSYRLYYGKRNPALWALEKINPQVAMLKKIEDMQQLRYWNIGDCSVGNNEIVREEVVRFFARLGPLAPAVIPEMLNSVGRDYPDLGNYSLSFRQCLFLIFMGFRCKSIAVTASQALRHDI